MEIEQIESIIEDTDFPTIDGHEFRIDDAYNSVYVLNTEEKSYIYIGNTIENTRSAAQVILDYLNQN